MARAREILFRIFYSTSFTIVFLILVAFLCVSLADIIYQSYKRNRLTDIFIVAGAYVLTALFAIFLYASRLYTNRSVLRDIPKSYMPIEKEDLPGKRVKKLIDGCLARSAVVAYQAKPRSKRIEHEVPHAGSRMLALTRSIDDRHLEPRWGIVAHPGWASPASKELPNLEYATVLDELVDLIEAKAVSLAPIDPAATPNGDGMPIPDQRIIETLTRPETMGMRQYLFGLIELGVVPDGEVTSAFLAAYERARFGAEPLSDTDFQALMRMFAELLRNMTKIEPDLLDFAQGEKSHPHNGVVDTASLSSGKSTFSNSGSVRHRPANKNNTNSMSLPRRMSEDSVPSMSEDDFDGRSLQTAPLNRSVSRPSVVGSRKASAHSRPSLHRNRSNASVHSTQSSRSNASVIRLASPSDRHDLPYTIRITGTETN